MLLEKKILWKIFGPIKNNITKEWRRRQTKLETIYNENNVLKIIKKIRLRWTEHIMRSRNSLLRIVIELNSVGKTPLRRPKMKWEDTIKRKLEVLLNGLNWKMLALNRNTWRVFCELVWSK